MTSATLHLGLVGNPNCGKTALFNALTGSRQKVANYAGVTVERKEGKFVTPAGREIVLLDLPGTYSLRARSPDEQITRDAVLGTLENECTLDAIVCVADATNLRLMLRLVLELKQTGRKLILALNMYDIAKHRGIDIDIDKLSGELGIPVVPSVAVRRNGTDALLTLLDKMPPEEADAAAGAPLNTSAPVNTWAAPDAKTVREMHRTADLILKDCVTRPEDSDEWTARVDRVLLHPVYGIAILLGVLFLMFQAVFSWATPLMDMISAGFEWLSALVQTTLPDGMLRSLISDGIISGVGSVLVFLPQIVILFLFIILLEDVGYMARAAFLMDKLMGRAGLHGRAFIPLLSSFACAIPGIMGTRVINSWRDRLVTILVSPLMTCSARIPVYTLIIAAFIPRGAVFGVVDRQGLVMFGLYAAGIVSALGVAMVMRLFFHRHASEPFIMELPDYKLPSVKNVAWGVFERARIFLRRAGTIILTMMIVIWFLSSFPAPPPGATEPAIHYSLAGMIGHAVEPILKPIGFNWQIAVALITGMAAREVAVAALGTVYAVGGESGGSLTQILSTHWSLASGLAFLAWYVFAPQCASTLAVVKRETNSWRWPTVMFVYMLVMAYIAAMIVYQATVFLGG